MEVNCTEHSLEQGFPVQHSGLSFDTCQKTIYDGLATRACAQAHQGASTLFLT
jgi:hypothetical protein